MDAFWARFALRKVGPFIKIEGVEIARLAVNNLRVALEQHGECPACRADVDRLPKPVEHQDRLFEYRCHARKGR